MRWVRRLFKKTLNWIPLEIKQEIMRSLAKVPTSIPESFELKVADSMAELEDAFRLVYQAYVKLGYCEPNPYKMRATKYHALPSTSTLIAKDSGRVVATLTLVRDNRLGLPLESVFNVGNFREKGRRVAEVTSLVIDKDYRRRAGGVLLFPMMKLMYEYSTKYFGISYLVIAIHPRDTDFYKALLLFEEIPGGECKDYYGAPATVLFLDLEKAKQRYKQTFGHRQYEYNYEDFFVNRKFPQIKYPIRSYNCINDPVVTAHDYQKLFVEKLGIVLPEAANHFQEKRLVARANTRFEVQNQCSYDRKSSSVGVVKDVSLSGLRIYFDEIVNLPSEFTIQVAVSSDYQCELFVRTIWKDAQCGMGLEIIRSDQAWEKYITYLEERSIFKAA